jgi:hypothetical protein
MALYGSSVPIEGLTTGAMVVTVICPNTYSHQRLMQALLSIVPDAGEPNPREAELLYMASEANRAAYSVRDPERDDDEGERDFTACRVEGGCE